MPLDSSPILDAVARAIANVERRFERKLEAAIWAEQDRQRDPVADWERQFRKEMQ